MSRWMAFVSALVAGLVTVTVALASPVGPPKTEHQTWCGPVGNPTHEVTMWLTAGMAAGDTFWLTGWHDGHYLIQSYRHVVMTEPLDPESVPPDAFPAEWASIGKKKGLVKDAIECRGFFDQGDGTFLWVDSLDVPTP